MIGERDHHERGLGLGRVQPLRVGDSDLDVSPSLDDQHRLAHLLDRRDRIERRQ